jgi:hypothetical protein
MLPLARHLCVVVPEGARMSRRTVLATLAIASLAIPGAGCASQQSERTAAVSPPAVLPALVSSPDMDYAAEQRFAPDASEMRWLASRNDVHRAAPSGTPEVADPGAYAIITRDRQQTSNGRPWNFWTSETRVFQRGSGR